MSEVWKARDSRVDRIVVIKFLDARCFVARWFRCLGALAGGKRPAIMLPHRNQDVFEFGLATRKRRLAFQ